MNERKIDKLQKKYTQNLTRCKVFDSKSDALFFFEFKIWRVVFLTLKIWRVVSSSIQNLPRKENFNSKSCFLKKHEKCKRCRLHGVKRTKFFFRMQNFFKLWHVERFLIQNLTRCIFKICSKCYSLPWTLSDMGCPKKERPTMRGAVNHFLLFAKRTIYIKKLAIRMKVLVCENNSSETSSLFMVTDCLWKLFTGLTLQTACLRKSLKRKKIPW